MTKYNLYQLANGLRIIHRPIESQVVYCGYQINAGTRDEQPGEEGLAHFCEHATFKGTSRRKAIDILKCLDGVGGDLNAFTNKEETVYHAAILRNHFPKAADLLTDMVFHSTYPKVEIEKEKEIICDEIESYNDSPAELIYDEFENMVFGGHQLGHSILGTSEQLRSYSHEDISRFAARHYRPDNAVFFAYGDLDFDKMAKTLEKATAGFPDRTPSMEDAIASNMQSLPEYKAREIVIENNTHQAHVMIGNRTYGAHDDRRTALYLLNNILGGPAMSARLNLSLRERNGLVYTVESAMTTYSDTGQWSVYFGCDKHDISKCCRLVTKELQRMIDKSLSSKQIETAKKQIKGQIAIACDNKESFALDFGKSFLHYGWLKDTDRLFAKIDQLTAYDIQQVAQEVFAADRLSTLIIK